MSFWFTNPKAAAKLHLVLAFKENIVWVEENADVLWPVKNAESQGPKGTDPTAQSLEVWV